ncbi:MAG: hypothetical protein KUG73_10930 [Pseudomonadales bacterium]|nr:hypothetical protein [Pseudomonadales bacterium]
MEQPDWVTDKASWKKHCRRVVARTSDFIDGKASVIVCAREIVKLEFWLRSEEDLDFITFRKISVASEGLPSDSERQRWPGEARDVEDKKIADFEGQWKGDGMVAALSLKEKFEG